MGKAVSAASKPEILFIILRQQKRQTIPQERMAKNGSYKWLTSE
jgi:hypothetical protein